MTSGAPRRHMRSRIAQVRFAKWPEALRERWVDGVTGLGWSSTYEGRVKGALGNLIVGMISVRGTADALAEGPPSVEEWVLFEEIVDDAYTPRSSLTKLELATHGLPLIYPDADVSWLIDRNRRRRAALTPPKAARSGSRPSPTGRRQAVPVAEWPADWRSRWASALAEQEGSLVDLLDVLDQQNEAPTHAKRPCDWSAAYRQRIERGLGLLLGSMRTNGYERANRAAVTAFVTTRLHHAETSLLSYLWEIYRGLGVVEPSEDYSWLATEVKLLKSRVRPRDRSGHLVPIGELRVRVLEELIRLRRLPVSRTVAVAYRDALLLALLSYRPDRPTDVVRYRLGKEVVVGGAGAALTVIQQKTGGRKVTAWPSRLVDPLRAYLSLYRPLISHGKNGDALWLSGKTGDPLTQSQIGRATLALSRRLTGKAVSPHFVRNCFLTSVAEEAPQHLDGASLQLGHCSERSSAPYRGHARSVGASRALEERLAALLSDSTGASRAAKRRR